MRDANIRKKLLIDYDNLEVPEKMDDNELEEFLSKGKKEKTSKKRKIVFGTFAGIAACLAISFSIVWNIGINSAPQVYSVALKNSNSKMASSYDEIYERLHATTLGGVVEGAFSDFVDGFSDEKKSIYDGIMNESASSSSGSSLQTQSEKENLEYSDTNEQTENVHEADIVKTDGNYIYILNPYGKNPVVSINKVDGKTVTKTSKIKLKQDKQQYYSYSEMYVVDNRLIVIGENYEQSSDEEINYSYKSKYCGVDPYSDTYVFIYDISDRTNPILFNSVCQDGYYVESRLVNEFLYLFTNYTVADVKQKTIVPEVNNEKLSCDCIYLPGYVGGTTYTTISSINVLEAKEFQQSIAIPHNGNATIYASEENIYLAISNIVTEEVTDKELLNKYLKSDSFIEEDVKMKSTYKKYLRQIYDGIKISKVTAKKVKGLYESRNETEIVKIKYNQGDMSVEQDKTIEGRVNSNMSMSEIEGKLRVVTNIGNSIYVEIRTKFYLDGEELSTYSSGYENNKKNIRYNNVYALDSELNINSSITNLGKNEDIYGVRYFGDYGYFVTFENTDPLFAIDFTDDKNIKLLNKLKMPGFSSYLHFYSDNLLFGFGVDQGGTDKLKMEMFDITGGTVSKKDKTIVKDGDYSNATYDYKAILIDPDKNLIGFAIEDYTSYDDYSDKYVVYQYNEVDGFVRVAETSIKNLEIARGMYIGDYLYVVSSYNKIKVIDLKDILG